MNIKLKKDQNKPMYIKSTLINLYPKPYLCDQF